MAPERQAAYFGGDWDNFTYPRYDLDMAFFRVYEDDRPAKTENYLKWSAEGVGPTKLVFVSGHPGSTDRLFTYAQLEYQRDYEYPQYLKYINRRIQILREYSKRGTEQERRALIQIFGLENSKKALSGEYAGLLDAKIMAARKKQEEDFRHQISKQPRVAEEVR